MESSTEIPAELTATATPDMMQMFLAALAQMSQDNRDTTLAAIAEMKKPTTEEQEKKDAEKAALIERTMRQIQVAQQADAEKVERQASCGHIMPNGQTNFRGQVMSNGWALVFCSHCGTTYNFEATDTEANKSGLNVDKWGPNAHAIIKSRVKQSADMTPPPVPRIPPGATIIFG